MRGPMPFLQYGLDSLLVIVPDFQWKYLESLMVPKVLENMDILKNILGKIKYVRMGKQ